MNEVICIISNVTFWTAVGAISALIGAIGIFWAARQIWFDRWIKAQEIFTEKNFTAAREEILKHFGYKGSISSRIGEKDEGAAKLVCRKMDELARLKPYIRKYRILKTWGYPLGKSWMILEATVEQERVDNVHPKKWEAFECLGEAAVKKYRLREKNEEKAREKEQNNNRQL